jgi:hypothetical protein
MVANHHISQLLIAERVADIHSARGGRRSTPQTLPASRRRRLARIRRRAYKLISPRPA